MKTTKDELTDQTTKKAWEKNWEDIRMDQILEIFSYERVKKQMEIFLRVLPKGQKILEGGAGLRRGQGCGVLGLTGNNS